MGQCLPVLAVVGDGENEDDSTNVGSVRARSRRDLPGQLACSKTIFGFKCYGKYLSSSETRLLVTVMEMMPPHTKCVGKLGGGGTCRIN